MIIIKLDKKIKINKDNYNEIINSLNFESIECNICHDHHWNVHARYSRSIDFFNRSHKIKIIRIICCSCNKTHALLIQDMIPYSRLNHDDIISIVISHEHDGICSYHYYFLLKKYEHLDVHTYHDLCSFNKRNHPILFIPT